MYCKKCGNYIPDGIDRCAMCGWIKGTEVVEEKPENETTTKNNDPLIKFRIILNCVTIFVIGLMAALFMTLDYTTSKKNENMLDAVIYLKEGKSVSVFKVVSNFDEYFKDTYSSLNAILAIKLMFYFVALLGIVLAVIVFLNSILSTLTKDKKEINSITPFAFIVLAGFSCGFISTQMRIFGYSILFSILVCVIAIFDLIITYKKYLIKEKVLVIAIVSLIFALISFIVLQTNFLKMNGDSVTVEDYAFFSLIVDKSYDKKTLGIAFVIILNIVTYFIGCVSLNLLKVRIDSKVKSSGFFGIAAFVVLTVVLITSLKLYNKEMSINVAKINIRYYIALVCGLISQVLAVACYVINRREYNKTKVYNL